jgi:hypothetical protein
MGVDAVGEAIRETPARTEPRPTGQAYRPALPRRQAIMKSAVEPIGVSCASGRLFAHGQD